MKNCILFSFFILFINTFSIEAQTYNQAKELIVNSKEYADFKVGKKNYHVSNEIISFSNLAKFFEISNNSDINADTSNEVIFLDEDLLSLNYKKCGKIKIFFSEQKDNIFFAEVILYKKKELKYSNRPSFGSSQVYMFTIVNDRVVVKKILKIHYN